jgi:phage gp45-like
MTAPGATTDSGVALVRLPSGRAVAVAAEPGEERLTVHSPDGVVEVQVALTAAGPVVRVAVGGRLVIAASGDVAVRCQSLDVRAAGGVRIESDEFRAKTVRSVHINGETVRLNCPDGVTAPAVPQPHAGCRH